MASGDGQGGHSVVAGFVAELLRGAPPGSADAQVAVGSWQRAIDEARERFAPDLPRAEGLRATGRAFASEFLGHAVGEVLRLRLSSGGPHKAAELMVGSITRLRTNARSRVVVTGSRSQRIELEGEFVPEFLAGCLEHGFVVAGVTATVSVLSSEALLAVLEASW